MLTFQRGQNEVTDGNQPTPPRLTGGGDESQPWPQPRTTAAAAQVDGPQPEGDGCPPSSSPHQKNSAPPSPAGRGGFCDHPELIYRRGQPAHGNFRLLPKSPGWRPFHPLAKLSVDDVLAIRASNESNERLAQVYGVGLGTVKGIRSGRRVTIVH